MLQRAGPANGHTRFIDSSLCSGRVLLFIRKHTENNHKILRVFPVLFLPTFWRGSLHPIRPSSPWPRTSWSIRSRACFHTCALWNKSNWSYVIKDFGTLPLIFSTSKYFRWKFQPCPSFFSHVNIPDKWKRGQLSLEKVKKKEKVKVKSWIRYLATCSIQKIRWYIWRIFFSDFRSIFSL